MARVRGRLLIDAVGFVEDSFGPKAPSSVWTTLPQDIRGVERTLREDAWYPLEDFVAYLVAAKSLLAPAEEGFYRRQGRYAGERQKRFLGAMATSQETQRVMAPTIWRMYFDVGRLLVVRDSEGQDITQIHDFPTTPELCERLLGAWEGVGSGPDRQLLATETRCALKGSAFCEVKMVSSPAG